MSEQVEELHPPELEGVPLPQDMEEHAEAILPAEVVPEPKRVTLPRKVQEDLDAILPAEIAEEVLPEVAPMQAIPPFLHVVTRPTDFSLLPEIVPAEGEAPGNLKIVKKYPGFPKIKAYYSCNYCRNF